MIAEEPRIDATQVTQLAQALEGELARLIVGQKPLVRDTVIALIGGGHVLLEGVPGLGKTVLVRSLGQALSMSFSRIQFTPDMMPADIVGTNVIGEEDLAGLMKAVDLRIEEKRIPSVLENLRRMEQVAAVVNAGARLLLLNPVFDELEHLERFAADIAPRL